MLLILTAYIIIIIIIDIVIILITIGKQKKGKKNKKGIDNYYYNYYFGKIKKRGNTKKGKIEISSRTKSGIITLFVHTYCWIKEYNSSEVTISTMENTYSVIMSQLQATFEELDKYKVTNKHLHIEFKTQKLMKELRDNKNCRLRDQNR